MPEITIQGTQISYDDKGSGGPPIVFLHGWGGSRADLAPQVARFAAGHRVVAVDRPGHGASPAPSRPFTLEGAADALGVACRELGLAPIVLVQHSYDRLAYAFAARHPELIAGLVVLDGPTLAGPGFDEAASQFLGGLRSDQWREAVRAFADNLVFPPGADEETKQAMLAGCLATPREVLVATWAMFVEYDPRPAIEAIRCPVLHVAGSFPSDQAALQALCPQAEVAEVRGVGHFIQLDGTRRCQRPDRRFPRPDGGAGLTLVRALPRGRRPQRAPSRSWAPASWLVGRQTATRGPRILCPCERRPVLRRGRPATVLRRGRPATTFGGSRFRSRVEGDVRPGGRLRASVDQGHPGDLRHAATTTAIPHGRRPRDGGLVAAAARQHGPGRRAARLGRGP